MDTRSWFRRLLSTYLPIFYFVVFLLILVFFMGVNQLTKSQTARANENYAKYVMQEIESSLLNIDQNIYREIDTDEDIRRFIFKRDGPDENEYLLNSRLSQTFNNIKINSALIHSLYLFRLSDGKILTTSALLPEDRFGDREFAEELRSGKVPYTWTGVRQYKLFAADSQSEEVVSLVRKVPLLYDGQGYLVVNVSTAAIRQLVGSMTTQNVGDTTVYDADGSPIVAGKEDGPSTLARVRSDYMRWEVRTGLAGGSAYGFVSAFFNGWIILGLLVIAIGTFGIVLATKRYTSPIDGIVARFKQYAKTRSKELPAAAAAGGQAQFIEAAFEHLLELAGQYSDIHHENLVYRRKTFFIELVGGERTIGRDEWEAETRMLGMSAPFRELGIGIFEIDKYAGFSEEYSYRDQNLIKFVISSVVKETAAERGIGVWSEWLEYDRLAVLFRTEEEETDLRRVLAALCDEIRRWIGENLQYTVTVGIGMGTAELGGVPKSFGEAEEALTYKSSVGLNRIILYGETERDFPRDSFACLQLAGSLAESFKLRDRAWEKTFDELIASVRSKLFLRQDIVNLLQYLLFHISKKVAELPGPYRDIWERCEPERDRMLAEFDTLDDLQDRLKELLGMAAAEFGKLKTGKNNQKLIQNAKRYIEDHYRSPDLSLGLLSERFAINQSYLSRLFKEELGENFVDYLARIRIMQAKELLRSTEDPIQKIAVRVGYLHYFSFNRVFKKIVGVTPGEYRSDSAAGRQAELSPQ